MVHHFGFKALPSDSYATHSSYLSVFCCSSNGASQSWTFPDGSTWTTDSSGDALRHFNIHQCIGDFIMVCIHATLWIVKEIYLPLTLESTIKIMLVSSKENNHFSCYNRTFMYQVLSLLMSYSTSRSTNSAHC